MGANANMQLYFAGESARSLRKMERRLERERRLTDKHMVDRYLAQNPPAHRRVLAAVRAWVWEKFTR